jgi:sulfite exporter TauE/SafE
MGMCGGIIGALTFSLPREIRDHRLRLAIYVITYNLGRVSSYAFAGAIFGTLGHELFSLLSPKYGHLVLLIPATLLLVSMGLYLAGWMPRFAMLDRLGAPIWRYLQPISQRMLPVRSPLQAYLFGLLWGWLPCGLVYTTLLWAASAGSTLDTALLMLAFGLGTFPVVITAGIATGWVASIPKIPHAKQILGVLLIVIALVSLGINLEHAPTSGLIHDSHEYCLQ